MDIEDDIMEMRAEEQAQMAEAKITLFELVTSPTLKLPLLIAIIMQLSQQLSGINAVSSICPQAHKVILTHKFLELWLFLGYNASLETPPMLTYFTLFLTFLLQMK